MQISRHWRMNAKRYRLEGVRYSNGEVRLLDAPPLANDVQAKPEIRETIHTEPRAERTRMLIGA